MSKRVNERLLCTEKLCWGDVPCSQGLHWVKMTHLDSGRGRLVLIIMTGGVGKASTENAATAAGTRWDPLDSGSNSIPYRARSSGDGIRPLAFDAPEAVFSVCLHSESSLPRLGPWVEIFPDLFPTRTLHVLLPGQARLSKGLPQGQGTGSMGVT